MWAILFNQNDCCPLESISSISYMHSKISSNDNMHINECLPLEKHGSKSIMFSSFVIVFWTITQAWRMFEMYFFFGCLVGFFTIANCDCNTPKHLSSYLHIVSWTSTKNRCFSPYGSWIVSTKINHLG
jgi:hypothetical protein